MLTSSDVTESSSIGTYCVNYCGWHYSFSWNGQTYVYAFVGNPGNPSTCPSGCNTVNKSISPNNSPAVDTMVNQMAHEIVEAVTDPYGGAWTDGNGGEAGDVCAYNYGG